MSIDSAKKSTPNLLQSHWSLIDQSRKAMAKEISSLADSVSGPRVKQLHSISQWLRSSRGYEAVLERPDVLCFCLPCLNAILSKPTQEPLSDLEMAAAIGVGYCKFENNAPMPRDLTPFLYPTIALLAYLGLITLGSVFVLPSFREMYKEFGIELPLTTQWVLSFGEWVETYWIVFFVIFQFLFVMLWVTLRFSQRGRAYSLNWFDRRFSKFRTQLSIWASHVANLMAIGVNDTEAIQIAGRCSANSNLQSRCDSYAGDSSQDLLDPDRYPLISNSLLLKNQSAKIAIFEETARYYRSLSGIVGNWWLAWLGKAILVLIAFTLFIVIGSLFMPMISIVSGLTG